MFEASLSLVLSANPPGVVLWMEDRTLVPFRNSYSVCFAGSSRMSIASLEVQSIPGTGVLFKHFLVVTGLPTLSPVSLHPT